jgi:hypothetical protein
LLLQKMGVVAGTGIVRKIRASASVDSQSCHVSGGVAALTA